MTDEPPRPGLLPPRRSLLRAGAAAAVLPLGFGMGGVRAWGPGPVPFDPGPICRPTAAQASL